MRCGYKYHRILCSRLAGNIYMFRWRVFPSCPSKLRNSVYGALTSHGCLVKQVAVLSGHDIERIRYCNGCTYKDCDGHRNAMHSSGFNYCRWDNAFLWRINKLKPYTNSAHRICFLDGLIWQAKSKVKSQVSHSDTRTKKVETLEKHVTMRD
jgi:hypothetical protein